MAESKNSDETAGGPVMLALSTFRQSDQAIALALEKAKRSGRLIIVHVADVNLARYFIGSDAIFFPELREKCEQELLAEHLAQGQAQAETIAVQARQAGLAVEIRAQIGRFALVCLEVVAQIRPEAIITTRSKRPAWVKRFFGSPVDKLIAEAGCPVIEA